MYNTDIKKCDYKNCENHRWPKHGPGGDFRSFGSTKLEVCNNCLAVRVYFTILTEVNNEWITIEETKVVEPSFEQCLTKE